MIGTKPSGISVSGIHVFPNGASLDREQRLGLFQIERIEALSEPAIDRGEKLAASSRLF